MLLCFLFLTGCFADPSCNDVINDYTTDETECCALNGQSVLDSRHCSYGLLQCAGKFYEEIYSNFKFHHNNCKSIQVVYIFCGFDLEINVLSH